MLFLLAGAIVAGAPVDPVRADTELTALAPEISPPDEDEMERLIRGEILRKRVESDGSKGAAVLQVMMFTDAQAVWEIIVSCQQAMIYVDGLEVCEVLDDQRHYTRTHQIVDRGWPSPRLDYVFEADRQPHLFMVFRLVEGNLKEMQGFWRFDQLDDGLLVSHAVSIRPKTPAPRWLVRRIMMRGMTDLLTCIRGLAEGSGTEQQRDSDLASCPGDAESTVVP